MKLRIRCKKSEQDICPAIYYHPNAGGFRDVNDLHDHWHRKFHPMDVCLFSDGLRLTGAAARPYHSQTWLLIPDENDPPATRRPSSIP